MRDRASVNTAALRTVKVVYPKMIDIGCFSHTLDRVGEQFCTPNFTEFISAWISLLHTVQRLDSMVEQMGSDGSIIDPVWRPFLQNEEIVSPSAGAKLLAIVANARKKTFLELELAATVDWGQLFVNATYLLEGDGPLVVVF